MCACFASFGLFRFVLGYVLFCVRVSYCGCCLIGVFLLLLGGGCSCVFLFSCRSCVLLACVGIDCLCVLLYLCLICVVWHSFVLCLAMFVCVVVVCALCCLFCVAHSC